MRREIWKAAPLALGLLTIAAVAGCPSASQDAGPGGTASRNGAAKAPARRVKPMLDGWSKPPFAIVLSGEQHGYMEPCGCSATQSGGLSRRADFFRQLDEKGWKYVPLDLGGLVRKDNQQNKLKFQVMLAALGDMSYKVLGLGSEELGLERMEAGFLVTQGAVPSGSDARPVPAFVNSNVEFTLFKGTGANPALPTKVITVDGHKIGVTSVFGKGYKKALFGDGGDAQIAVKDPESALPAALEQLKKEQPEVLVLLAHAEREESRGLAKKFPDFDLVVSAGGPEDGHDTPEKIGKTLFIEVGRKGKHVGVVACDPANKQQPFRFELVDLDRDRFRETPKMNERMREYQQMLEANYDVVLADLPKSTHPSGGRYAGVETCKSCHTKAYGVWRQTPHAHAYEALLKGRKESVDWVPRHRDPECLSCHVTGWDPQQMFPYESGFISADKTPHLLGQQCENCHGPAAAHVEIELKWKRDRKSTSEEQVTAARRALKLTEKEAAKTLCYRCHDLDNDPNFSQATFPKYWEKVRHPGRD
jgi:hypothetical protein